MRDTDKARQWAFKGDHLKVYPEPLAKFHNYTNAVGKKIQLPYVRIVIEIGNAKHLGKESYKQNSDELTKKMNDIYLHYYNKRGNND